MNKTDKLKEELLKSGNATVLSLKEELPSIKDSLGNELNVGDKVEFDYCGSVETQRRQIGVLQQEIVYSIEWQGGTCPIEAYAENIVKL